MLALVVYVLFVTPYELAFVAHVKKTSALYACNMFVDVAWCDVYFSSTRATIMLIKEMDHPIEGISWDT